MPELPEVETTRRGIEPHVVHKPLLRVLIRESRLRWPVPELLCTELPGQSFSAVERRGKYLLFKACSGTLIIHLGMSGSLRILNSATEFRAHDHVDFAFNDRLSMRFHDPRRFGCILWTTQNPAEHALLAPLGPEPLSTEFNADYLFEQARKRQLSIKSFLMDSHIVAGIGNIYANEALFLAQISPLRSAGRVSRTRLKVLCEAVDTVLRSSIQQGGTTLRDFVNESGQPGYFQQTLNVYDREGEDCPRCKEPIKQRRIGQRSSFYCPNCQR